MSSLQAICNRTAQKFVLHSARLHRWNRSGPDADRRLNYAWTLCWTRVHLLPQQHINFDLLKHLISMTEKWQSNLDAAICGHPTNTWVENGVIVAAEQAAGTPLVELRWNEHLNIAIRFERRRRRQLVLEILAALFEASIFHNKDHELIYSVWHIFQL